MNQDINETWLTSLSHFCHAAVERAEQEGYYVGARHITQLLQAAVEAADYEREYCRQHNLPFEVNAEALYAKGQDWVGDTLLPSMQAD